MPETVNPPADTSEAAERRRFDGALAAGVAWTAVAKTAAQVVSWAVTLILARLLTQADYGIVGMALVFTGFIQLVNELGIGAAIVQRHDLTRDQIASIGGFAILTGFGFSLVTLAASPAVGWFYGESAVVTVLTVMGLNFTITSFRTIPHALLTRDLRFRTLAWLEVTEALVLSFATLTLASLGAGYWALVLGVIVSRFTGAVAAVLVVRHPIRWPVPFAPIAGAVRFGADVVLSRISWYLYSNADFLIVGKLFGKEPLGNYTIGWTMASLPVDKVHMLYNRAAGAVIAKVQRDPDAVARYALGITEGVSLISFPAAAGLALVADQFVSVVLTDRWLGAVGPLRLLALAAALRAVGPLLAQLLISTGQARANARIMMRAAVIMPILFLIGSRWGMVGVAGAWVIGYPVVLLGQHLRWTLPSFGISTGRYLRALRPAMIGVLVMSGAVLATRGIVDPRFGTAPAFFINVSVGVAVYSAVILGVHRRRVKAILGQFRLR